MTRYLLDTNVLSETRKPLRHGGVTAWLEAQRQEQLFLPALVFGEVQNGVEIARRSAPQRVASLEFWLGELERYPRILAMHAACFGVWARMTNEKSPELAFDAMIAATAEVHELTVVTRNVRDFNKFGVSLLNPFEYRG